VSDLEAEAWTLTGNNANGTEDLTLIFVPGPFSNPTSTQTIVYTLEMYFTVQWKDLVQSYHWPVPSNTDFNQEDNVGI
jgi:hypothetical protein